MRRRTVLAGAALAVGATATGGAGWWWRRPDPTPAAAHVPTGTAAVTRTDLSTTTQVEGALGYRGQYSVFAQGAGGTVTALPQPGQLISRGQQVFELDGRPVRLFYGDRPAWRGLALGVTDGPDVRVLEENLGVAHPNNHFDGATATAVRHWQTATGQAVTGRVDLGTVVVEPGPIRVTAVTAKLGSVNRGDEPMLSATSTAPAVTISVPATQTYLVHVADKVTVTLPDGKTVPGSVAQLSAVADAAQQDPNGRPAPPTVSGLVILDAPDVGGGLDQAPVQVNITSAAVKGVLVVPITALVALAGGGYGVYVLDAAGRHLVGVTPGLFADTLVEVRDGGLHEGDKVEVPAT